MPESKGHSEPGRSRIDETETEQLERMVQKYFDEPDDENTDMDTLVEMMEVIRKRKGEDTSGKTEESWDRFNRLYRPLAESGESLYGSPEEAPEQGADAKKRGPRRRRGWRSMGVLSKAACIVLALVVLTFAGAGVASAAGYDVWDAIATWTDETFTFRRTGGNLRRELPTGGVEGEDNYASLQEALDAYGITVPLAPQWIPEGYALTELSVGSAGDQFLMFCAAYRTDSEMISETIVFQASDSSMVVEKDAGDAETYEKGGVTHYIMTNGGDTVASWANGPYECVIDGSDLSEKDMKRIINSVYWRK